jgi:cytochrome c peroxidase
MPATPTMSTTSSRRRAGVALAALALSALGLAACGDGDDPAGSAALAPTPLVVDVDARFGPLRSPRDNPLTVEGVALGRRLFFDPLLSVDGTISCASCHRQEHAFSDPERFSQGVAGQTPRQSMSLANLAWAPSLFWDGRAASLEEQVLHPVADPVEMGETWDNVERKLAAHDDYPTLAAFPGQRITRHLVARAIAQFERTLLSADSRYDRHVAGQLELTQAEQLGLAVFESERAECFHCHGAPLFTDNRFHNTGLDETPVDDGLGGVTGSERERGRFRTPTLRNIAVTAPYMHDGRFATLDEVLDHYDGGLHRTARVDPLLLGPPPFFSDEERAGLLAFLRALTDDAFLEMSR